MASFQFCVNGQRLTASERYAVGESVNYLDAVFVFSDDWGDDLRKTAHFTKDGVHISRIINDGIISKADGLNLSAGMWKVTVLGENLDGDEYVERITTNAVTIRVNNAGITDGEPFPEITPSIGEMIVERAEYEADRSETGARDSMVYAANAISAANEAQEIADGLPDALKKYIEEHADELHGEDGFSPLVDIIETGENVKITITDKHGAHVATIPTGSRFEYVELHTVWRGNYYEIVDGSGNVQTFADVVALFNDPDTFVYCVSSNIVHLPSFKEQHGFAFIGAYSINNEWHLTRVIINDSNEVKLTDAQTPSVDDVTMLIFEYLGDYATKAELQALEASTNAGLANLINDGIVSNSNTWSSEKIASELAKLEHTLFIDLYTIDGKPVNVSIDVKAEATGELVETVQYNNAPVSIVLPTDFAYAVTIGECEGYERLENDTFTGIMNHDITITATFRKGTMYGFHVNENEADPSTRVTYIADAVGCEPARMVYANNSFNWGSWRNAFFIPRPCMLNRDGTVAYYLDENDYSKREDGEPSDIANVDFNGNAMMEWGRNGKRIYYKLEEDSTGWNCYISNFKDDDSFKCWSFINNQNELVGHFYTPIYQGSLDANNCLRSLSGKPIMIEKNGTEEITYAKNNNLGSDVLWYTEVNCDRTLIDLLLYLMGKSTDLQTVFGQGHTSGGSKDVIVAERTGTLDDKGMFFGYSNTTNSVKVFGMENWWGCQYRRVAGLMQNGGKAYYKNTYGTADGSTTEAYTTDIIGMIEGQELPDSGYPKTQRIENDTFVPKTVGGGSTTYYCDYYYINKTAKAYALFGGGSTYGTGCGRYVRLHGTVGYANWNVGASLSCKPLAR